MTYSRLRKRKNSKKTNVRYYGISDSDFEFAKLDESVSRARTWGKNDAENKVRAYLNKIERYERH